MLLEMETNHHASTLLTLNMPSFNTNSGGGGGGGGAGNNQQPEAAVSAAVAASSSPMPPPQYSSPPISTAPYSNNSCQQINLPPHPYHHQQPQQHHHQNHPQHPLMMANPHQHHQHQQQHHHHHHHHHQQQQQQQQHHHNSSTANLCNLDSYLFSSGSSAIGGGGVGGEHPSLDGGANNNNGGSYPHHHHHHSQQQQMTTEQHGGGITGPTLTALSSGSVATQVAATTATSNTTVGGIGELPDTKYFYIEELCPVCGDKVSGYHYGLLTCESCKGFFKRTVQNKKIYTCVAERSCHIDKTQRKRCPFCRFQKCLEVGMKLEAVRADRMRGGRNKFGPMYKRDRARKLQLLRQRQMAAQTIHGGPIDGNQLYGGGGTNNNNTSTTTASSSSNGQSSSGGAASAFTSIHIKQEIQIPQVSSLTSSPDSSPSPIAVALGQVSTVGAMVAAAATAGGQQPALQIASSAMSTHTVTSMNVLGGGGGGGGGSSNSSNGGGTNDSKLWNQANSTTTSPHSLSPSRTFQFEAAAAAAAAATTTTTTVVQQQSGGGGGNSKVSPLIRDFLQAIDDHEWQNSLYSLLQSQTYNQCEVDLFELMCKVLDQNLFSQVDWARNSIFFKDLKVDDQMKLLQHSWSDMLVLDHIHQRMHSNLPDEMTLHNGQKFDLLSLGLLGVLSLMDHFKDITAKFEELKVDIGDYICVKFLLLLNPEVRGITNRRHIQEGYQQVQQALLEYTVTCYPQIVDKFNKMMQLLPEIHDLAARGEEYLYHKHCTGSAPTQTLLMEMLHAKRK